MTPGTPESREHFNTMTDADTRQWVKLVCEIVGASWEASHPGTVLGTLRDIKEKADCYEGLLK